MTDRPIIFSAAMVRALIREAEQPGTGKTQTRRTVRDQVPEAPSNDVRWTSSVRHAAPYLDAYCGGTRTTKNPRGMTGYWCWWTRDDRCGRQFRVPFVPGDRLWVREATHRAPDVWVYTADEIEVPWPGRRDLAGRKHDKASPLFLPRSASRLTLHVTDVRVERLQDISEADAIAEGVFRVEIGSGYRDRYAARETTWADVVEQQMVAYEDPRLAYADLWNSLHGPAAWDANPWIVAITFRPVLANIDAQPLAPADPRVVP